MDTCRLCGKQKELKESHIIPDSIIKWELKKRESYLRNLVNPNVRRQDGIKKYLLCAECEDLFGKREKLFADKIFYPRVNDDKLTFEYDSWLYYFMVSILWRLLVIYKEDNKIGDSPFKEQLLKAQGEWQRFLFTNTPLIDFCNFHLMVIPRQKIPDEKSNKDYETAKKYLFDFDTRNYFMKSIDMAILTFKDRCVVYAKFNTFLLFAPITPFSDNEWKKTKINNGLGKLIQPQETYDVALWQHLIQRAITATNFQRMGMSNRQVEKAKAHIEKYYEKNKDDEYR